VLLVVFINMTTLHLKCNCRDVEKCKNTTVSLKIDNSFKVLTSCNVHFSDLKLLKRPVVRLTDCVVWLEAPEDLERRLRTAIPNY